MKNIFYRLSFGILLLFPFFSWGNVQVANLKQDLELISRELAGLRSEVELLRRENAQLRAVVDSFAKKANSDQGISSAQLIQINSRLSSLEKRVQANTGSQAMIQTSVNKQMQELIKQMNDGFRKIVKGDGRTSSNQDLFLGLSSERLCSQGGERRNSQQHRQKI